MSPRVRRTRRPNSSVFSNLPSTQRPLTQQHRRRHARYVVRHCAPAVDYKEAHARCLNRVWDEELPAGSLIDERLEIISYDSYSECIACQYDYYTYQYQTGLPATASRPRAGRE